MSPLPSPATSPAPTTFGEHLPIAERGYAWEDWMEAVIDDVKGGRQHAVWLREPRNLLQWLRGLVVLESDVSARIAEARLRVDALKPLPGEHPTRAYLEALREHDERHGPRVRFRQSVTARLVECRFLLAEQGLAERQTPEHLLATIVRAAEMLETDDVDAALALLNTVVRDTQKSLTQRPA